MHLNCGLHDLKRSKSDGHHQVELDRYAENLRRIVARIRDGTDAALVFADTTPILDDRHARRGADFDRTEADVRRYNAAAAAVMGELGVPVHDLHWVVEQGGPEAMLGPDGTHYTDAGSDRLAEAVADCVLRQVTVRRYRPPAAAGLRARGRRGVPQDCRPVGIGWSPRPTGGSRSASSASRRTPPPGRSSGRRSSGPSSIRSATCRPGPRPREPGSSPESSAAGYTLEKVVSRKRRGRRGDGAAARPGRPEGAGAGDPLAPLLDPRQDAGHHPRDQRRRGVARRGLRACGLRRARPRLVLARRPRRHRAVGRRRNRAGPSRRTCSS